MYCGCDWVGALRRLEELDFRSRRDCRSLRTSTSAVAETVFDVGSLAAAELPALGGFLVSFRDVCLEEVGVIEFEEDGTGLRSSI